jgi:TANFOR domain-containing protein
MSIIKRITAFEVSLAIASFLFAGLHTSQAQFHPVQVTVQLVPPYSVYLADYATPGNEKLRLLIVQRDHTKPSYQIRVRFSIELNGTAILQTSSSFHPPPINLDPGLSSFITGIDLQPYFDSRNLDFVGISRDEYERTKTLPEGSYQICVTAYDYRRQDIAVSAPGCSFFSLAKDEPPLLNFPPCGTALPIKNPQQISFSWLPRNTSSINSAEQTEYEFALYETRPAGRNPNDVVLSSNPIYKVTTSTTQLTYGMAEPLLLENIVFVWRVQAKDKSGKDQFRNNGFSEPCTFAYGGTSNNVQLGAVLDVKAEGKAPKKGFVSWADMKSTEPSVDGYTISYKKKSASKWFSQEAKDDSTAIFDLEPNVEYQVQVQAHAGPVLGPFSDIVKFTTPKIVPPKCGDPVLPINASADPLLIASSGMTIDVQGFEITLNEVQSSGQGVYSGKGVLASGPYFGNATFHVTFKDVFINSSRIATKGRVDFVTSKLGEWIDKELEEQKKNQLAAQQEQNRQDWQGTDFYPKEIVYDFPIDSVSIDDNGNVILASADGKTYTNSDVPKILVDAPGKAIIIEDKAGNQWVVQKDPSTGNTKVTPVPGGGLSPNMDVVVSQEALDIVRKALKQLADEYDNEALTDLEKKLNDSRTALQKDFDESNFNSTPPSSITGSTKLKSKPLFYPTDGLLNRPILEAIEPAPQDLQAKVVANGNIEQERNRGKVLNLIGKEENIDVIINPLTREVRSPDSKPVSEYIADRKKANASTSSILDEVKGFIKTLIDTIIEDMPVEIERLDGK